MVLCLPGSWTRHPVPPAALRDARLLAHTMSVVGLTCWETWWDFGIFEFVGDLEYLSKGNDLALKQQVEFIKTMVFNL